MNSAMLNTVAHVGPHASCPICILCTDGPSLSPQRNTLSLLSIFLGFPHASVTALF